MSKRKRMTSYLTGYKEAIGILETRAYVELCADDTAAGAARAEPFKMAAKYLKRVMPIVSDDEATAAPAAVAPARWRPE
jgi:hypothetical protein